jgi:fatty-acyl-CoA synthase
MLSRLQTLESADPQFALHLYDSYSRDPLVVPYREFPARIAAHAASFRAQGVRHGDRVLFPFETSLEAIFGFFGLLEIGALPFSVKPVMMGTPKATYRAFLLEIARRYGVTQIVSVPGIAGLELGLSLLAPADADARAAGARLREPAADELAFVQFSSGSTSFPKGIPITHGKLLANLQLIVAHDGRTLADRVTSWLPLYHDMGLIGGMLSCFMLGHDLHLADPRAFLMDPFAWFEHMSERRLTGSVIPNFAIDYALKVIEGADASAVAKLDLTSVRSIYLGSEPINIPNLVAFLDLMAPAGLHERVFLPCYGMAETVLMVTCAPRDSRPLIVAGPNGQAAISVGALLPGFEMRLRSETGNWSAEGELGEIELRGDNVADDYFEDTRTLRDDDGYYRTGDLGFVRNGALFITGRLGDRIKINGQSFFAGDFEQAAEHADFVRLGRVAAIQPEGKLMLVVEVTDATVLDGAEESRKAVIDAVFEFVGIALTPAQIHFVKRGQIQRTSSGKLQRRAMALAFEQGTMLPAVARDAA